MTTKALKKLVLLEGIELSTSPLPRECSTTELQQPPACFLWITANAVNPDRKNTHRTAVIYRPSATVADTRFVCRATHL